MGKDEAMSEAQVTPDVDEPDAPYLITNVITRSKDMGSHWGISTGDRATLIHQLCLIKSIFTDQSIGNVASNMYPKFLCNILFVSGLRSAGHEVRFASPPGALTAFANHSPSATSAYFLYATLCEMLNAHSAPFALWPTAMARDRLIPRWSVGRYREAIRTLTEIGALILISRGHSTFRLAGCNVRGWQ